MSSASAGPVLGIDLGTTNSAIAITDGTSSRVLADPEGNRLIPSCVSFHPDGSVLVGHQARERRLVDAGNTVYSIKRLIGRPFTSPEVQRARDLFPFLIEPSRTGGVQVNVRKGIYALPEISAYVLRHLRKVAEHALGVECKRAVITVPANFNELQRSATQAAGKVAGLEVLRILHEPTAATLAYGYGRERPETIVVYDFGGGTFDVTVLDLDRDVFEVVSTAGDTFLGGDDIDLAVAQGMADACLREHRFDARTDPQAFERMRAAAEWAKCQLSSVPEAELTLEELFIGDAGSTVDFTFRMTRDELIERMRPLLARTFDVVGDALREAGRRPREIDNVVLVGGSTRIPLVRQMVEEFFGKPPRADIDPDLVVAQGAAIHGWTLAGRPEGAPRPGTQPLGRSALRKITVADVAPGAPRMPRQPAFAPPPQVAPPVDRAAIAAALAASSGKPRAVVVPPPSSAAEPSRSSLDPVAVLAAPTSVGDREHSDGGLLDLDDPHAPSERRAPRAESPDRPARTRAIAAGVPTGIDAPFDEPAARPLVAAQVDDPFDVVTPAPKRPRRDATVPFGHERTAPPIDAPFDVEGAPVPQRDALADDIAALEEPLPLPEPMRPLTEPSQIVRDSMTSGLFEVELESMPPDAPAPSPTPQRRPPPPPPGRPPPPPPPPPPRRPDPPSDDAPPPTREHAPPPYGPMLDPFASIPPEPPSAAIPLAQYALEPPASPPLAPHVPELPLAASATAPLLMDVTPLSLGLETAGGFCAPVVPRNAPVPAEKSRVFSTGRDDQDAVELRICQGEATKFADNELLGTLALHGIRKARRGEVRVEVTFLLDASGILDVRATDLDTGRAQHTRIHLSGGLDQGEIDAMRARQERELA